ncbi:unnamed protein product [Pleuronectes platessa]|uniref:Uncharacterized protein n=1 Tax=Pleuronectes platessa TaxID=8262 RepID=A0A9N7VYJ3_PLEPL|nr:unnamed protein product [Pleuronectes platessa]
MERIEASCRCVGSSLRLPERKSQEYHPLSLASFRPPSLPPWLQSGRAQPRSLISIAGLRNTGPVVDMLTSYPTGADKLLASLSLCRVRTASQRGSKILDCAAGHGTICLDQLRGDDAGGKCGNDEILLCDSGAAGQG